MDVLLVLSFGGPEGPDDVVPFLANVTRGRGIPPERLAEVGVHYERFGGVSPLNQLNRELVAALRREVTARSWELPVVWGNRNWEPFLDQALGEARGMDADRVFVLITSAYSSYAGCRQYRENLADALAAVSSDDVGQRPTWQPLVVQLRHYFNHPAFVGAMVDATLEAMRGVPPGSRLVFTTHSIPTRDAQRCDYVAQHRDVAATIAERVGHPDAWDLVYQSRSGSPGTPWLEPDIADHLALLAQSGAPGAVMVPIGFVSDHMEVVWDLDTVATEAAATVGLPVARAATAGADDRFVGMVLDLVQERRAALAGRDPARPTTGRLGPRVVPCAAGCCPNPRGPRPALCEARP